MLQAKLLPLLLLVSIVSFHTRLLADVNVLIIGSTHSFSEGGESGIVHEKPFNPTATATSFTAQSPICRKDHQTAGLTYTVEFSSNLTCWKSSASGLSVVSGTSPSAVDAVAVHFPATVPLSIAETEHAPPKFFRVAVAEN